MYLEKLESISRLSLPSIWITLSKLHGVEREIYIKFVKSFTFRRGWRKERGWMKETEKWKFENQSSRLERTIIKYSWNFLRVQVINFYSKSCRVSRGWRGWADMSNGCCIEAINQSFAHLYIKLAKLIPRETLQCLTGLCRNVTRRLSCASS